MRVLTLIAFCLLLAACAQQRTPLGGPKDETGPQLILAQPAPMSTNFTSDKIELRFDEYIRLEQVRDQVLISPPLDDIPEISIKKGKTIQVDFRDIALRPNTTYTINFGEAIKDNNEGNVLEENVFLFSTGSFIDTLELRGQVLNAETREACVGCLAMLYPEQADSLILSERPYYVARSNAQGDFVLSNLAPGQYQLMALRDANANLSIDPEESLGFASDLLSPMLNDSLPTELLLSMAVDSTQEISRRSWSDDGRTLDLVSRNMPEQPAVTAAAYEFLSLVETLGDREDSLRYWFSSDLEALSEIVLTSGNWTDTIPTGRIKTGAKERMLEIHPVLLHADTTLKIGFNLPVGEIDPSLITLRRDSLEIAYEVIDQGIPSLNLRLSADWEAGLDYELVLDAGAVTDIYGRPSEESSALVKCPEEKTFGKLSLNISLPGDSAEYHLALLDKKGNRVYEAQSWTSFTWTLERLAPEELSLRVYRDTDGDGRWTPGDFDLRRQPEAVYMHPESFSLRANWEIEQTLEVEIK